MRIQLAALFFALTVIAEPLATEAQPTGKIAKIGTLRSDAPAMGNSNLDRLRRGLGDLGYVEGRHYILEPRWAEGRLERLPALALELVRASVDVIVTAGPPAIRAARQATTTIPIVMGRMDDADAHGFVATLARPGGNITGLSFQSGELSAKWLELLREAVPRLSRVGVLWDSASTTQQVKAVEAAARAIGVQTHLLEVRRPSEYEAAFQAAKRNHDGGVVILASPVLTAARGQLATQALRSELPAVYYHPEFAKAGGLLSYGPSYSDFGWDRAAAFVDKILKGAKPADLPVEQPTTFELVINLKTARTLGLTLPPSLLLRANQVIE
jgi:putative ABC transport system substrate-binding protein